MTSHAAVTAKRSGIDRRLNWRMGKLQVEVDKPLLFKVCAICKALKLLTCKKVGPQKFEANAQVGLKIL